MTRGEMSSDRSEIKPGFAFHYENDDHLFFVVSDFQEPEAVIMNLTTVRSFSDTSCVIQPGEHPFVTAASCVAYNFAEIVPSAIISDGVGSGTIVPQAALSPELMARVWDGAAVTRHLPLKC